MAVKELVLKSRADVGYCPELVEACTNKLALLG